MKKGILPYFCKWMMILVILYFGWCGILYVMQEKFIFFPTSEYAHFPTPKELQWEEVRISTQDNEMLEGFWLNNQAEKTVLFFHGNAGNISHRLGQLFFFQKLKVNALMIDYRGYGKSTGTIQSENDLYLDGQAGLKFLEEKGISNEKIFLWGESLGTGIALELAQKKNFSGVILEAPFLSFEKIAQKLYWFFPVKYLLRYEFMNEEKIKHISSPILFFHSPEDEVIPFSHGQELFTIASEPKKFISVKGTHGSYLFHSTKLYLSVMKEFFDHPIYFCE
jgi:fermentation-respiration switch protein FrsA (DUF1100 family)